MKYMAIRMICQEDNGTDSLGNPISMERVTEQSYLGRFCVWTAEEIQLIGRDVSQVQRKMLTNAPLELCLKATGIQTEQEKYTILSVSDLNGRWRMLTVERMRVREDQMAGN